MSVKSISRVKYIKIILGKGIILHWLFNKLKWKWFIFFLPFLIIISSKCIKLIQIMNTYFSSKLPSKSKVLDTFKMPSYVVFFNCLKFIYASYVHALLKILFGMSFTGCYKLFYFHYQICSSTSLNLFQNCFPSLSPQ